MFNMGMGELMVILAVALLVLGPKRLPELATGLGKAIREFRKATRDLSSQLEVDESVAKPLADLKSALRDDPTAPPKAVAPSPAPVPAAVPAEHPAAPAAVATSPAAAPAPAATDEKHAAPAAAAGNVKA